MLNQNLKLNSEFFSDEDERKSLRDGFGEGLVIAGEKNKNVIVLCADLEESTRVDDFARKFPERFFETGVAEQNMAAIAAGLGVSHKIPFISSFAVFSPGRNWEQIRTTIAYNKSNVKIAGHHAGVAVGEDGATHQALEDVALMRVMPNMTVLCPCDAIEAKKAALAAAEINGPVYIRLGKQPLRALTTEDTPFNVGRAEIFWEPKAGIAPQCAIIACGSLVGSAILAAKELEDEDIHVIVLNIHTIKPIDLKRIIEIVERTGAVVTVEEHQIAGGMGSAVAEVLAENYPVPIEFIGVDDVFGESGKGDELIEKYGMGVRNIKEAAKKVLKRKVN
ncbi:MAG: transketolase C-terminal domain-containing protein [Patescibacteria group bacterium]|nr:transketolase C-terminal domain-containing protein [Patescibacteria group bacterium]